jgi:hypothetical protein
MTPDSVRKEDIEMSKGLLLKLALVLLLINLILLSAACNAQITNPVITTTETSTPGATFTHENTLPSTAPADSEQLMFPDKGIIWYDGKYYTFQRVFDSIDEPAYYQGVIFAPYVSESPITAPVGYWLVVTFADGTVEELQYIGFADQNQVNFRFTKHDNPRAGVMLASQYVGGGLRWVEYLLVSEQL